MTAVPLGGREGAPQLIVVDDDPGVRLVLARALARFGYEVFLADSGAAALAELDERPDVVAVLTDIDMTPVDGIELTRHIRSRRPDLPILYITANPAAADLVDLASVDVLAKPVGIAQLRSAIERVVQRTRRDPGAQGSDPGPAST